MTLGSYCLENAYMAILFLINKLLLIGALVEGDEDTQI